ncbi:hypothetical protein PFISCL1PPCAC_11943, partial [Pristionchus fissidentatus]
YYRLRPKSDRKLTRMERIRQKLEKIRTFRTKEMRKAHQKWENLSAVEKLPVENLYNIFTFAPESMGVLRLTSSYMKKCVDKCKSLRGGRPTMKEVSFCLHQHPLFSLNIFLNEKTSGS